MSLDTLKKTSVKSRSSFNKYVNNLNKQVINVYFFWSKKVKNYLELLSKVLLHGYPKEDRTGTGTYSLFGGNLEFDLTKGLPIITTKKINLNAVIHELLWFISGDTNTKYLNEHGVRIWDEWADESGVVNNTYGHQWRNFNGEVDQLENLINNLKYNPNSRRHVMSAWNPMEIEAMGLPSCHVLVQFDVSYRNKENKEEKTLSCQLYQRSADMFLGVPFNITSYSLLTFMLAHILDYKVGEFKVTFGDMHIYKNHIEQVNTQLGRVPILMHNGDFYHKLSLNKNIKSLFDFKYEDILIKDYCHLPYLPGTVSV